MECPARELVDERWAWLSAVLAGRVFTHRLGADEVAHDMLAVSPDLDPITSLCEHDEYQRLVDGSAAQVVLAEFDDELLEERGIPVEAVDPGGALLLEPRTLTGLQVTEGDLVGLRLTEQGLTIERVTAPVPHAEVGARLAAVLDDDEPRLFDQVVWTACVEDPAAFTEPLAPLSEIADDCGLTRRGEWLAPAGFDFARWDFERGCARLVERHDIDPDDAFAVYTLVQLHEQVSLGIDAAESGEPHDQAAPRPTDDRLFQLLGKLGAALADPLLAVLLVDETIGSGCEGAAGWPCWPRCWSRRCHVRRKSRFAGCARWRWNGSAPSTRPSVSCWRPSRWIRTGRCRCWTWPALPPIAATSSTGWDCCAALASTRTTRCSSCCGSIGPSREAGSAATNRAGAGRVASTRNAISGVSGCRWPSGHAGCMRRPSSTRCGAAGMTC
ncbi:putative sEC-C motif containing protein [Mycobacterium xenopi 4042]|uniref:Putative sEC-C motif containing protein n=1 Tax=Mycobacterium xenopi 4042 TaxID=1299334 RepID=X8C9T9_MYCXE|nr:putative sEC-C motif containing protein [Mycobacterium xenopi 4042]